MRYFNQPSALAVFLHEYALETQLVIAGIEWVVLAEQIRCDAIEEAAVHGL